MLELAGYRLDADYHTHTRYSHGKGSVRDNALAARHKGLKRVAISDHGPANLFGVGTPSLGAFDEIRKEVNAVNEEYPDIEVLLGVEANVIAIDGTLDIPSDLLNAFDVTLVGLHPLVRWKNPWEGAAFLGQNLVGAWVGIGRGRAVERNTEALINAVTRHKVDCVTHPGYRLPIDTEKLAKACAEVGCALEISSSHEHTSVAYIQTAKKAGARFMLGSDAHSPERVGDLRKAAELAKAAGLQSGDIVNACP